MRAKKRSIQIAVLVQMRIVESEYLAIGTRRDDRLGTAGLDALDQGIGVVALVGDDRIGPDVCDQVRGEVDIGDLPCTQYQSHWVAQSIHCGVDFGAQSAARADRLRAFFGCPRGMLVRAHDGAVRNISSKSASLASSANVLSQTPLSDQRPKRLYTLFQSPNSAGRSRHGLPVRATHSTASMNSRLSSPVRPGSPALPGNIDPKRCHWSSRNHRRTILTSRKYQDVKQISG